MNNQDEVRERLGKKIQDLIEVKPIPGGCTVDCEKVVDFFISEFDTLLAKKREETQRLQRLYIKREKTDPRPDYDSVSLDEVLSILS